MATIKKPLEIVDKFSGGLNKYIEKMREAVDSTETLEDKVDRLAKGQQDAWQKMMSGADKNAWKEWTSKHQEEYAQAVDQLREKQEQELADLEEWNARHEAAYERRLNVLKRAGQRVINLFRRTKNEVDALGKTTGVESVTKRLTRMVLTLVSARRLLTYFRNAIARAPDAIMKPFTKLKSTISDFFAGGMVAMLSGLTDAFKKLEAAFKSSSGQRFARGMEAAFRALGTVLGFVIEKLTIVITWLGDHFTQVATAAAVIVGVLAVKFAFMAAAAMAAHWPLVLIAGAVIGLISLLDELGVSTEQVFNYIGQGVGWLYSLVYNLVADAWNLIASFAEFFANVWHDPLASVARLFVDVFDSILGVVETTAKAIDALLGSNLSSSVTGWRNSLQAWADDKYGEKAITVARMEKLDVASTMDQFGSWAGGLGASLTLESLERAQAQSLKSIASDTKSIKNAVTDEELQNLIDVAARAFVAQVNLTSQTPVITINGANTGDTEADRRKLGEAIKYILMEQVAAGSTSSPYVYSGR